MVVTPVFYDMKHEFKEIKLSDLVEWIETKKIDLNPSYQRNFIWSPKDQSELIDTMLKGFPLPNFFIYIRPDGNFEMVDGQQRATTIYSFVKGKISSTPLFNKAHFSEVKEDLKDYLLPVIFLSDLKSNESLKDFYVLINKKGKHLNLPEVNKSEFHDTNFL